MLCWPATTISNMFTLFSPAPGCLEGTRQRPRGHWSRDRGSPRAGRDFARAAIRDGRVAGDLAKGPAPQSFWRSAATADPGQHVPSHLAHAPDFLQRIEAVLGLVEGLDVSLQSVPSSGQSRGCSRTGAGVCPALSLPSGSVLADRHQIGGSSFCSSRHRLAVTIGSGHLEPPAIRVVREEDESTHCWTLGITGLRRVTALLSSRGRSPRDL